MFRFVQVVLLCSALSACGAYVPLDQARMPMRADAPVLSESHAIGLVEYQLADPASTRGDPETGAMAAAAGDWLAGQDGLNGDYGPYKPGVRPAWVMFRRELRAVLGIAPGTPSQVVVDRLMAASLALKAARRMEARNQLQPPAFTLGPDATLDVLGRLPDFATLPLASSELQSWLHRERRCSVLLDC